MLTVMEHLPLPLDPIRQHPSIPLATRQFDDPGPFLTYPERHSYLLKGTYPHVPTQADALKGRHTAGVSNFEVIDFFEGWLFFSLLQEFLGDLYHWQNYTKSTIAEDGSTRELKLSTKTLHDDIAAWTLGRLATIQKEDSYHKHLEECLTVAEKAFNEIET